MVWDIEKQNIRGLNMVWTNESEFHLRQHSGFCLLLFLFSLDYVLLAE